MQSYHATPITVAFARLFDTPQSLRAVMPFAERELAEQGHHLMGRFYTADACVLADTVSEMAAAIDMTCLSPADALSRARHHETRAMVRG